MNTTLMAVLTIALFGAAWFGLHMLHQAEKPMQPDSNVKLQFLTSRDKVRAKVEEWKARPGVIEAAKKGLIVDTAVFVPLYTLILVAGCLLAARWWPWAGRLAWCAVLGGLFDLVENFCCYQELQGSYGLAPVTFVATALKTLFIVAAFPASLPLIALLLLG